MEGRITRQGLIATPLALLCLILALTACGNDAPPMGQAIAVRDSLPVMTTKGVTKLISDSGIVRFKVIAEQWLVYDMTQPPRQEFPRGITLLGFDDHFDTDRFITADTAWCWNQNLWRLRGNVVVRMYTNGTTFTTDELYWDMARHEFYSDRPMHVVTPDRELRGTRFRSNEQFTTYHISQSSGYMPKPENAAADEPTIPAGESAEAPADTMPLPAVRPAEQSRPKRF